MKNILITVILLLFTAFSSLSAKDLPIIPQPNHVEILHEDYKITQSVKIQTKGLSDKTAEKLQKYLSDSGIKISENRKNTTFIQLYLDTTNSANKTEGSYELEIRPQNISIKSSNETGLFYGIQSLLQLISGAEDGKIPCIYIKDTPRFAYRGIHLDVSRHFFSIEFIKKQLDMMAYFKLNKFHWHLTDGPGWRLEIKKYPLLTEVAAWRTHATWKDWWASPRHYVNLKDTTAFGGFYTQEEVKEIVRYAAERYITVIPEIEMPGHSEEVLAVYPELSCTEKPYTQSEFCVGNEATFTFLTNVLSEVMKIFPSEYIHIGGDEADKSHWKKCEKCQARMKKEGLKSEEELQSYLIKRIEKYLIANNRKLLGWDEILEGGLAPEATVMSWRGEDGGIKAVKSGHNAIMTPGSHCYFDSYQANPATQPEAIGGFLPLEKVYDYNPVPKSLTPNEAKHILGTQANLWTEYVSTESHAEYMLYPRLLALSEVAWTKPEKKSWTDFKRRVSKTIPILNKHNINTFTLSNEVAFKHHSDTLNKGLKVMLETEQYDVDIRYTLNGNNPDISSTLYKDPIIVTDSAVVTAQIFKKDQALAHPISKRFDNHLAIDKSVNYNIPINDSYPANGKKALVDGLCGSLLNSDGRWQGFMTTGMDVTIDLAETIPIHFIQANFMQSIGAWIYFPAEVVISISDDNIHFKEIKRTPTTIDKTTTGTLFQNFGWSGNKKARYIRYQALPNEIKGGWVFLDEIVVW